MQSLPTITRNLLLINVLALLANGVFGMFMANQGMEVDLNSYLALYYIGSPYFQIYQLVTYMFMHGGWIHLIFNMFALWMFGGIIERMWGPKKFLFYYLACGIGAGLTQEAVQFLGFASPFPPRWEPRARSLASCWHSACCFPTNGCLSFPSLSPSRPNGS